MLCILNSKQIGRIIDILSVFYFFPVKRLSGLPVYFTGQRAGGSFSIDFKFC